MSDAAAILDRVKELSITFARERSVRQRRRELIQSDFDQLKQAGFLLTGVPVEQGGIWETVPRSTRPICEMLRVLAHGDPSVALVSSMHPAVLAFWLTTPQVPAPFQSLWESQRRWICQMAHDGAWWGTITSEPGSGGDIAKTRAAARRTTDGTTTYLLTGHKHFGSGSGICSYMMTTAVPEGETEPDLFYLDVREVPWDGSSGMKLTAPWDGHGMIATQSHGFAFESFPTMRVAWPGNLRALAAASGAFIGCAFTAVIVGIVETAISAARQQLESRQSSLRAYEKVEWTRAELDGWLIQQAFEGMLRAVESGGDPRRDVLQGKAAIAELAESALGRLCRVMGGGSYARYSPFGFWAQDVRALGFLRPPWGLAYDTLYEGAWASS